MRLPVAVAALIVGGWFAFTVVETHELARATAIVSRPTPLTPAQRNHAASLLHDAGRLNPDRSVDIVRAQLALRAGRDAAARRIIRGVVSAEPHNLEAWYWLARASGDRPELFSLALLKIRQLEPPVH